MYLPAKVRDNWKLIQACITSFGDYRVSLAGGCIRDALFYREVKDVDIYIVNSFSDSKFRNIMDETLKLSSKSRLRRAGNPASATDDDENTMVVLRHVDYPDCDIIFVNQDKFANISKFVHDRFDSSICQVWFNFGSGLGYNPRFNLGRKDKKVFWYKDRMNGPTFNSHYDRVRTKYSDWEHVNV